MLRRLNVSLKREIAIEVSRVAIDDDRMVYVLVTDKPMIYPNGKSRIVYIGKTENGVYRIAYSIAQKSFDSLVQRGVQKMSARILTCPPRQGMKTWVKLERAMLIAFREKMGDVPEFNVHGKNIIEKGEFSHLFSKERILRLISDLS